MKCKYIVKGVNKFETCSSNARTSFLEALVLVLIAMFVFCVLILDSSWDLPFNDFTSRRGLLVYVHLVAAHLVNLLTSFAKVSDPDPEFL